MLFIKSVLNESVEIENVLQEDIGDTVDNFMGYVERKLRGYSTSEIDMLAGKAKKVDSEVKKRSLLTRIEEALKDAKTALQDSKDEEKKKELRLQISVLGELKTKVNSFSVLGDKDEEKSDRETINLDE